MFSSAFKRQLAHMVNKKFILCLNFILTLIMRNWLVMSLVCFCLSSEHKCLMEVAFAYQSHFKFAITTDEPAVWDLP